MSRPLPYKSRYFGALFLACFLFFLSFGSVEASCRVNEGAHCDSYTVPSQVAIGDDDPGPGINTPSCKKVDQINAGVDDLEVGNTYKICCDDPQELCSEYKMRSAICGSAEESMPACQVGGVHLSCWGNNYRRCDTDGAFPAPAEGDAKRQGYLVGDGSWVESGELAGEFEQVTYNGVCYGQGCSEPVVIPNGRVWFCDSNVANCGPGTGEGGEGDGESRLWYPHLRLISALSTITQSLFVPHPSTLVNNSSSSGSGSTIENTSVITTKIEEHQSPLLNDTNNSSMVIGRFTPDPLYTFGKGGDDNLYNDDATCSVPEVFNNPGDDLIGPTITGRLLFTQRYQYEACPKSAGCVSDGQVAPAKEACCSSNPDRGECDAQGLELPDGSYQCGVLGPRHFPTQGKVAVFVKNPLVEYVFKTLVSGEQSLYRRFMPSISANDDFKDIPSSSSYTADAISNNEEFKSVGVKAGKGGSPTVYFPYVGSTALYWLDDFQNSLRPQVFGTSITNLGSGGGSSSGGGVVGKCSEAPAPYCNVENLMRPFGDNETAAKNASQICGVESGGSPAAANKGCVTGASLDYSIGLFQIYLLAHTPNEQSFYDLLKKNGLPTNSTCPSAFAGVANPCTIVNQKLLDVCQQWYQEPNNNISQAVRISSNGTNWCPWSASRAEYCNQCPNP